MGPQTILIDGYNVIRNTPGLARAEQIGGLPAGRAALLAQLRQRYQHTAHSVTVVFDGAERERSGECVPGWPRSRVIFSRQGELADAVIVELCAAARARGEEVRVISDDAEVRGRAAALGGATARVDALAAQLNQPSRDVRRRTQHRLATRREWEARGEAPATHPRVGNGHRAPRRRR